MRALICCALAGCAVAVAPNDQQRDDAAIAIDARPSTDAAGDASGQMTLTQTTSSTITPATSVGCAVGTGSRENSYYRVFALADHGITSFTPTRVELGVQTMAGSAMTLQVRLHVLAGTAMQLANLTQVATASTTVDSTADGTVVSVPIVASSVQGKLVVEVLVPDSVGTNKTFLIGANSGGESKPGYIRSPACGTSQPATFSSISYPNTHIVLNVAGLSQ